MANKKIWLGMLVMALAFGMTVVGCGDQWEDPVITVENGTAFQVKSVLIEKVGDFDYSINESTWRPIKSDPAGISPGAKKSYTIAASYVDADGDPAMLQVRVTLIVTNSILEATITKDDINLMAGYNKGNPWNSDLLLSGTSLNSLQLNKVY